MASTKPAQGPTSQSDSAPAVSADPRPAAKPQAPPATPQPTKSTAKTTAAKRTPAKTTAVKSTPAKTAAAKPAADGPEAAVPAAKPAATSTDRPAATTAATTTAKAPADTPAAVPSAPADKVTAKSTTSKATARTTPGKAAVGKVAVGRATVANPAAGPFAPTIASAFVPVSVSAAEPAEVAPSTAPTPESVSLPVPVSAHVPAVAAEAPAAPEPAPAAAAASTPEQASKSEPKAASKPATKSASKAESKSGSKTESKSGSKPESKAKAKPKVQSKTGPGIESKATVKPEAKPAPKPAPKAKHSSRPTPFSDLLRCPGGKVDLSKIASDSTEGAVGKGKHAKEETLAEMANVTARLSELQERLFAASRGADDNRRVLLILQGMDTAGKGGVVGHVVGTFSPYGVQLTAFKAPTAEERSHDFLWRIRKALPGAGYVGVFDRSQYEDVLIARVRSLVPQKEWSARYGRINDFERELADDGCTIVKCFLHVSPEVQRERLLARLEDETKLWKYNPADVDERAMWPQYQKAYEAALEKCSTEAAPWYIVPADRKWYRNFAVANLMLEAFEGLDPKWPRGDFNVAKEKTRVKAA